VLDSLLKRIHRERRKAPGLIVTLREFEVWCRKAGFDGSTAALRALCTEGAVTSYRIQSGRITLFFRLPS
jgi:hypothetical protein